LQTEEVLADTGYSSGVSYEYLKSQNITAYIPPIGGYKPEKDGFTYNENICSQGIKLPFKGIKKEKIRETLTKEYRAASADCRNCPLKEKCCKKSRYKQASHCVDKPHYDKAYQLLNTRWGRRKMKLRGKTVEPVWGTLLYFRGLKKVYTKGNYLANKQVLMAAAAHNLKKLMGFNSPKSAVSVIKNIAADLRTTVSKQIVLFIEWGLFSWGYNTIRKREMVVCYSL
jgi:hypothetical protein